MAVRVVLVVIAAALVSTAWTGGSPPRAIRAGALNVEPSMRPWRYGGPNPDGWWCRAGQCSGVADGTVVVDRELKLVAKLGVRLLRVEFPWPLIEPSRGVFDWSRADYIVRRARQHHVRLLPVLLYTPRWIAASPSNPPDPRSFSAFVSAFARRYRARLDVYELWNEPDLSRYWTGSAQDYVRDVLLPGSRAVKANDHRARIVLGGTGSANASWLNEIYRFGGGRSFDVLEYHDYSANQRILSDAYLLRGVLRAHRQARKPIWLGEYGVEEAGTDDPQQRALIRVGLTGKAPIALAGWYALRDDRIMSCCPPATIKEETFGLLTDSYEPKQAYATMRTLLRSR